MWNKALKMCWNGRIEIRNTNSKITPFFRFLVSLLSNEFEKFLRIISLDQLPFQHLVYFSVIVQTNNSLFKPYDWKQIMLGLKYACWVVWG